MTIYWMRIVCALVLGAGWRIAEAQPWESVHVKTTVELPALHAATVVPFSPTLGLGRPLGAPVLLQNERGGLIGEHRMRFLGYQRDGVRVELRGGCYSACTLITGYVPKDKLCVAPGAFLAFHSALLSYADPRENMPATLGMYLTYPKEIRDWIDLNGGVTALRVREWWTLYDRDLWAMGYAKCR